MKYFLILLFAFPIFANSQILHEKNGEVIYTDVITVDSSITKTELFNRAKAWIAMEYKSANAVIQMEDANAGILIGKGIFMVQWSTALVKNVVTKVPHTIKLLFKDGKYKYEISNLSYLDDDGNSIKLETDATGFGKKTKEKFLYAVNDEILNTINSLEDAMKKPLADADF